MNIADRIRDYYDSEDFKGNYADFLGEDTHNCINAIKAICRNNYQFQEWHGENIYLTDEQAERILDWWRDNGAEYISDMRNYYVGGCCIDSISFGEQEEQLDGLYNNKTGRPYNVKYLKQAFDRVGFVISGDYAYLDLTSSGVKWDLRDMPKDEFKACITDE